MLRFCRQRKNAIDYVVVYRVDRFARLAKDHAVLEAMLGSYGAQLRSVTEPIDESNAGRLMGTILSGMAEFDNRLRADRTKLGIRTAISCGRWPGRATLGYNNARDVNNRPIVVLDDVRAPLIQLAFQKFATGLYTEKQIRKELTKLGLRTRKGNTICRQHLEGILRNPFYAGWIKIASCPERQRGNFPAIIDQETFDKVQAVLKGQVLRTTPEVRNRPEFPLRRFAKCGRCGARMTASWNTNGMNKRYPYYVCNQHSPGINIRKEELERQFLEILGRARIKPERVALFKGIVRDAWREKQTDAKEMAAAAKRRLTELESNRRRLLDAYLYKQAISEEVFKQESSRLETEIAQASIDATLAAEDLDVGAALDFACQLVTEAADVWPKLPLDQKQRLQKVLLPDGIVVGEDKQVRTDVTCSGFDMLQMVSGKKAMNPCLSCDTWNKIIGWLRQIYTFKQSLTGLASAA